jgi:hypothetical protein
MTDLELQAGPRRLRSWIHAGLGAVFALAALQVYERSQPEESLVSYDAGSVIAVSELDTVLDDPSRGGGSSGITASTLFASGSNDRCRRFAQGYLSGTACFRDGVWRLIEMKQADPPAPELAPSVRTAPQ